MKYARIIDWVAVDVISQDPAALFHPAIASQFVEVSDDVTPGATLDPDTSAWTPPAAAPAQAEAGNLCPTPPEFMASAFTFQERVAIRTARATDPVVDDFLTLIYDPRLTMVDLTLPSTQDAIGYLTTTTPALLTPERAAQVLAGLPAPSSGGA